MTSDRALGLIETLGFIGAVEASDAACKAAHVELVGYERVQAGIITVQLRGDVAAVSAAVDAGSQAARRTGQLLSTKVIPAPALDLEESVLSKAESQKKSTANKK